MTSKELKASLVALNLAYSELIDNEKFWDHPNRIVDIAMQYGKRIGVTEEAVRYIMKNKSLVVFRKIGELKEKEGK